MVIFLNNIIKKIKNKDKDLEGMYVITDEIGKIIGFNLKQEKLQDYLGLYNYVKDFQGVRIYKLDNINLRKKIKKIL